MVHVRILAHDFVWPTHQLMLGAECDPYDCQVCKLVVGNHEVIDDLGHKRSSIQVHGTGCFAILNSSDCSIKLFYSFNFF